MASRISPEREVLTVLFAGWLDVYAPAAKLRIAAMLTAPSGTPVPEAEALPIVRGGSGQLILQYRGARVVSDIRESVQRVLGPEPFRLYFDYTLANPISAEMFLGDCRRIVVVVDDWVQKYDEIDRKRGLVELRILYQEYHEIRRLVDRRLLEAADQIPTARPVLEQLRIHRAALKKGIAACVAARDRVSFEAYMAAERQEGFAGYPNGIAGAYGAASIDCARLTRVCYELEARARRQVLRSLRGIAVSEMKQLLGLRTSIHSAQSRKSISDAWMVSDDIVPCGVVGGDGTTCTLPQFRPNWVTRLSQYKPTPGTPDRPRPPRRKTLCYAHMGYPRITYRNTYGYGKGHKYLVAVVPRRHMRELLSTPLSGPQPTCKKCGSVRVYLPRSTCCQRCYDGSTRRV